MQRNKVFRAYLIWSKTSWINHVLPESNQSIPAVGWYYNGEYHPHKPQCKWLDRCFLGESQYMGRKQKYVISLLVTHNHISDIYYIIIIYPYQLKLIISISWVVILNRFEFNSKPIWIRSKLCSNGHATWAPITNISHSHMSWHDTATSLS